MKRELFNVSTNLCREMHKSELAVWILVFSSYISRSFTKWFHKTDAADLATDNTPEAKESCKWKEIASHYKAKITTHSKLHTGNTPSGQRFKWLLKTSVSGFVCGTWSIAIEAQCNLFFAAPLIEGYLIQKNTNYDFDMKQGFYNLYLLLPL